MEDCDPSSLPLPPDTDDDDTVMLDMDNNMDEGDAEAAASASSSVSDRPSLKTPDEALAYWNASLEKGSLSCHHFREWWRRVAPKLLSPTPTMDYKAPQSHIDDEEVKSQLLRPLEQFIFSGDPASEMERLSKLEDPPAQCCKLFRMGEPTYSCRDCGHDPTCVLCVDCFKRSEHRHHRYKMSTSCGGGYCDCGDVEAFSAFPHCDFHGSAAAAAGGGAGGRQAADPLRNVPQDIQDRTRHVFASVMRYAYDMLTTDSMISLPGDLTFKESESALTADGLDLSRDMDMTYCTVVFNDEIHTFDEVITTLPRAVDCDRPTAISFATLIDRDGRSVIKCSGFQACSEAKKTIERITSRRGYPPLKVQVAHSHVVAHQVFAMRLLAWMQEYLDASTAFRALFSSVALQADTRERCSMVELVCRHDTLLWKSARTLMHHLLISGMLMENEGKRHFAAAFAKSYGHMMKDFMQDDHDHSFSITSLSVQLFTVPTLAHHLIAEEDVLAILLMTFMSECERKRNERGKLEFQRNAVLQAPYKRSFYILYDLKYLLTSPPTEWENGLRKGFLHGVSLLFDVLSWMQGMDPQVRQTTHHIEYEVEWESAFNLHIKLAPLTSLVGTWSGTDRVIYIKTIRMLLKKLWDDARATDDMANTVKHVVCDKEATCIDYQISSKPVSIHFPLSRALAGLSLHMGLFDLNLDSNEFNIQERPGIAQMIEPALRTAVLNAQVHAGMWRRNGYALVDQVRVYHDPRCRKEMYDQDVIMLQLGAANMDPDEFVIRMLDKFNLVGWSNPAYDQDTNQDDAVRQVATIVEEFLSSLIVILGERFTPGVGKVTSEEALKKEIIQLLCTEPMSHSALNRALAEDVRRETGLEKVVESVAAFKMPASGQSKGLYELKDEFYEQYNVFFYHYTREEQSKSEESQRSRLKAAGKPQCTPPPPVPEFTPQFAGATRLMDCDVFVYLLAEVLRRADNLKTRCFSEGQVHRALHLIGLCLNEEAANPDTINFTEKAKKFNILGLLEQLVGNQRIDSHKELLNWVIEKMRPPSTSDPEAGPSSSSPMTVQDEKAIAADVFAAKKAAAAARKAKIMAQMMSAQKNFIKENSELFEETPSDKKNTSVSTEVEMKGGDDVAVIALGSKKSPPGATETEFVCILCQEEQSLSASSDALVMAAFTQKSTVMSGRRNGNKKEDDLPPLPPQYASCPVLLADMPSAPHTSSCGHIMHAACWSKFYADIISHERQRTRGMRHPHSFDVERREFLCPLCRRLSNAVIPLIPQFHILQPTRQQQQPKDEDTDISFSGWIQGLMLALKYKRELSSEEETSLKVSEQNDAPLMMERSGLEDSETFEIKGGSKKQDSHPGKNRFYTCPLDQVLQELQEGGLAESAEGFARLYTSNEGSELKFADSVFDMMNDFCNSVFRAAFSSPPLLHDERIPMMAWQTCAYTIHSLVHPREEIDKKNPVFNQMPARHRDCLSALVRLCGIVGANFAEPKVVRSHALRLLSSLLEVDTANLSILEFDAFGMLIALTFALPSLFNSTQAASLPSCDAQDNNIVHLLFLVHIVQILLTKDQFSTGDDEDTEDMEGVEDKDDESQPVLDLLQLVRGAVGFSSDSDGSESLKERRVWRDLRSSSLPFLRCCAIFYQHLSDVALSQIDVTGQILDDEKEFEILMGYLNLPTDPAQLLGSPQVSKLAMRWANHPTVHITLAATSGLSPASHPLRMSPLMNLPDDYSELINSISCFVCPNSGSAASAAAAAGARGAEESRVPALCLVCGQLLCSQSYCCQTQLDADVVGACTAHADKCGAGNGIFLRVRECKVILLSGRKKGCSIPPPYLDRYGETDVGLRRGNPLHLCRERLAKIQKLWLTHAIPEEIAHTQESNMMFMAHRWQDL